MSHIGYTIIDIYNRTGVYTTIIISLNIAESGDHQELYELPHVAKGWTILITSTGELDNKCKVVS